MSVQRINWAINDLGRIPLASEVHRGFLLRVCEASEEAWDAFLESENQSLRSTHMQWIAGSVYIVEFPGSGHDEFALALNEIVSSLPHTRDYFVPHGGTYRTAGPRYEADASFGPSGFTLAPLGVPLPTGVNRWCEYMTLKVEVGLSRPWGLSPGSLDWKALVAWPAVPGVAFVLCIALDPDLQRASYKKYDLPTGVLIDSPTEIVAPSTPVQFDSRRLLGLPPGVPLPPLFPDPLTVDLFQVLQRARFFAV